MGGARGLRPRSLRRAFARPRMPRRDAFFSPVLDTASVCPQVCTTMCRDPHRGQGLMECLTVSAQDEWQRCACVSGLEEMPWVAMRATMLDFVGVAASLCASPHGTQPFLFWLFFSRRVVVDVERVHSVLLHGI